MRLFSHSIVKNHQNKPPNCTSLTMLAHFVKDSEDKIPTKNLLNWKQFTDSFKLERWFRNPFVDSVT